MREAVKENQGAYRVSPLLERRGEEADVPYAPAPWILKKCMETGLVFLANPPAYEELEVDFAYEVTYERESNARRQAEPLRYAFSTALKRLRGRVLKRNKTLRLVRSLIQTIPGERINILDVGCGWGSLLKELFKTLSPALQQRCIPHGVEISQELSRISNEKLQRLNGSCVHASAKEGILHFGERYFDVIIMASYLEHETNPLPVLRNCGARLKPGGSIIVKVPNYGCLNRMLRGRRWCGFRWPDHVNYFTPSTLRLMADKAGLRLARMTVLDRNPFSDNMYAVLRLQSSH